MINVVNSNEINIDKRYVDKINYIVNEYFDKIDKMINTNVSGKEDMLLPIAECFELFDDQNRWLENTYLILQELKSNLYSGNYNDGIGYLTGICNISFALSLLKNKSNHFKKINITIEKYIYEILEITIYEYQKKRYQLLTTHYDLLYGLAGAGLYLLQCDKCEKRNKILRQIISYLAGIILEEHDYKGEKVPNWFILPENHYTDNDKRYYKNGSLDFSVSHGIASIYVFMGNAYLQLIEPTICACVMEAIENTYQMFRVSENGIYYYPGKLRWEEYKLNKKNFMNYRQSWCYGTIGIEGTFFKISCQLNKYKKSNEIYQNIIKISEQNIEEYELESPIVCHGYAGILAIFLFTYKVKPNIKLKNQIIKLTEILVELYDKDAKFGYKDVFYSEKKGNWEKIFREDNSFLEGSSGIILVLVSLLKSETNFQKLLLL